MHRRKIVLISGSGRTGSTLLSLLLSQHKDVVNLGQLRDLPAAWGQDAPCTCGRTLTTCEIYSKVGPSVDMARHARLQATFMEDARRMADWSDPAPLARLEDAHKDYLASLTALLDALGSATGASTFVDASKSPEMALALSLTEGTDARVLNLVRDPRAVAVSWRERRGRITAAWKFSRDWAWRQRVLGQWSTQLGDRFLQLRYEDFAVQPRHSVEAVAAWADLPLPARLFESEAIAGISWKGQHLYPPANERVLAEMPTKAKIRPSEGWRGPGHGLTRWLAMLASGDEGRRYIG